MSEIGGKYVHLEEYDAMHGARAYEDEIAVASLYSAYFLLKSTSPYDAVKFPVKVTGNTYLGAEFYGIEFTVYNPQGQPDLSLAAMFRFGEWERRIPKNESLSIDGHQVITSFLAGYEDDGFTDDLDLSRVKKLPVARQPQKTRELVLA
jgi:hypothetical protein